ncbi:tellurite resistance TerB family protein [Halomonas sp. GXIMD04776]|uniref:tellurite resistance TerB family protein n=1 Tax=Halomonas sp. GXIMD04776 TaxID=3415605 RepID=UPI003C9BC313
MNAKGILDQLMKQASSVSGASGGSGTSKGGFDIGKLAGSGALGMLLGTKRGRKLGGQGLKYGALAGLGMLAWKAWQHHQQSSAASGSDAGVGQPNSAPAGKAGPLEQLEGQQQEQRSLAILQAMIAAARADGHIDAEERAQLVEQMDAMGADDELHAWMERQMREPLDAQDIAAQADSPQAAREMYLASVAIVDEQNPMERAWLDQLAGALELEPGIVRELEAQAASDT